MYYLLAYFGGILTVALLVIFGITRALRQDRKNWFEENYDLGIKLGYPDCCVREFCKKSPLHMKLFKPSKTDTMRVEAAYLSGEYTGLIPCSKHAKQVLNKEITLHDLIHDRDPMFPEFPEHAKYNPIMDFAAESVIPAE